jgi:hypothetical protein
VLTGIFAIEVLCLLAALAALRRMARPLRETDAGESFAQILAAAEPVARCLVGSLAAQAPPANGGPAPGDGRAPRPRGRAEGVRAPGARRTHAADQRLASGVPFADRLRLLRHMLEGVSAESAARACGVEPERVGALYRVYGWDRGRTW